MSTYPGPSPTEEKRPGFLHRPVPMWAFLLLVVIIGIIIFLPALLPLSPPTSIKQPLILTPDSRTFNMTASKTITANFTVANLNATNTIMTTVTITLTPATSHVNATIYGVQTESSFTLATNGRTVSFPPGGNTLVLRIASDTNPMVGNYNYTVHVSLSG